MKYCNTCGNQILDNSIFCPNCGNTIEINNYKEAVVAALSGDNRGFEYLYNKTANDKYYIALKYMKNQEDADDVLQDAYLKAWSKLETLDDPEKFPAWIGMIVANTAKNVLQKKNPMLFSDLENDEGEIIEFQIEDESLDANPEISVTNQERTDIINTMLNSLSEEQRLCITMFYLEERSIKEIAEILECSENTVKSRLNYGRKNLAIVGEEMKQNGYQFFGMAPLPLLIFLIQAEAKALGINFGIGVTVATSTAIGSSAVVTSVSGGAAAGGTAGGTAVGGAAINTGSQVATASTVTGTTVAKTASGSIFKALSSKFIIGAGATALAVTGTIAINHYIQENKDATTAATEYVEMSTESDLEEITQTTDATTEAVVVNEDEMYDTFIQDILIVEQGIHPLRGNGNYEDINNNPWYDGKGIICADIYDYDSNGVKDLFVISEIPVVRVQNYDPDYKVIAEMYTIKDNQVVLSASKDLGAEYQNALTGLNMYFGAKRVEKDGKIYITCYENTNLQYDYWRIKGLGYDIEYEGEEPKYCRNFFVFSYNGESFLDEYAITTDTRYKYTVTETINSSGTVGYTKYYDFYNNERTECSTVVGDYLEYIGAPESWHPIINTDDGVNDKKLVIRDDFIYDSSYDSQYYIEDYTDFHTKYTLTTENDEVEIVQLDYSQILTELKNNGTLPVGSENVQIGTSNSSQDDYGKVQYEIMDINNDGYNELVINDIISYYGKVYVYGYNPETDSIELKFSEFTYGGNAKFYDNGYVSCFAQEGQGLKCVVYKYITDTYNYDIVFSESSIYAGEGFAPDEVAIMDVNENDYVIFNKGEGVDNPYSDDAYPDWFNANIGNANMIEIQYKDVGDYQGN